MGNGGTGRRILMLLLGVSVVVALGCLACVGLLSKLSALPATRPGLGRTEDLPEWKPVMKKEHGRRAVGVIPITSAMLREYYERDVVTANSTLDGKRLEVRGRVDKVAKDPLDGPYVTFDTGTDFSVQCSFAADENRLARLVPGQVVTIRGRCSGSAGVVLLRDCELLD